MVTAFDGSLKSINFKLKRVCVYIYTDLCASVTHNVRNQKTIYLFNLSFIIRYIYKTYGI